MASTRRALLKKVVSLCGPPVRLVDARDGWPGLIEVQTSAGTQLVAAHVGPVTSSKRGRDDVERRFQNPGQDRPVTAVGRAYPVLLGLWEEGKRPVLVGMEPEARLGRTTRFSLFMRLDLLQQADAIGWADDFSTADELIVAFHPGLLPAYLEMRMAGEPIPTEQLHDLLEASGLTLEDTEEARERARRATSQLVRDAAFRKDVITAYEELCAMCGLDFGLLSAAHIYPASAPRSPDVIQNGLALCGNHHSALDRHLIWVHPEDRKLTLHPDLHSEAGRNEACGRFVELTVPQLREPRDGRLRPRREMFEKRYDYFSDAYRWVA